MERSAVCAEAHPGIHHRAVALPFVARSPLLHPTLAPYTRPFVDLRLFQPPKQRQIGITKSSTFSQAYQPGVTSVTKAFFQPVSGAAAPTEACVMRWNCVKHCHTGPITLFVHHHTPGVQMTRLQQMGRLYRSDPLCSSLGLTGTSRRL